MDSDAILMAFSSTPGNECLKSVIPLFGPRLKVYREIKTVLEEQEVHIIIIISMDHWMHTDYVDHCSLPFPAK